jgi:hypothetical protein
MDFKMTDIQFRTSIKLILVFVLFIIVRQTYSQVSITAPSLTLTACNTFPTSPGTLGDIIITETLPNDIKSSGTLILKTPSNFQYTNAGIGSAMGSEITSISIILSSDTTITLSFNVMDTLQLDTIILSGVQVRGIINATSPSNIINVGGTAVINGETFGTTHATLESTDAPTLTSSLSIPTICSGDTINYEPTSNVSSAVFNWTRNGVNGISNPSNSGTNNPNETLTDTSTSPVNITYDYTVTANGCTNPSTFNVIVTVNPTPTLSNYLSADTICSGSAFSYTPMSSTSGTSFNWTRASVIGISDTTNSGTDNPNEILTDTTAFPANTTYIYSLNANGCSSSSTYSTVVTVNPTPSLNTIVNDTLCNEGTVYITFTSNTTTNYIWLANDNSNTTGESITNQTTDTIFNIITNNTNAIERINYTIIPSATSGGCVGDTTLFFVDILPTVAVNSIPDQVSCYKNDLSVKLTSNIPSTFSWWAANNNLVSGETTNQIVSDTVNDVLINSDTLMQVVSYSVIPTSLTNGCIGDTLTFIAILNGSTRVTSSDSISICSGSQLNEHLTSDAQASFEWLATENLFVSGESVETKTNDSITDILINLTDTIQLVNYTVTPKGINSSCYGTPKTVNVYVQPNLNVITNHTISSCSGTTNNLGGNPRNNCTYSWTPTANLNDSTISNPSLLATNNSNNPITIKYYVLITDTISSCQINDSVSFTINPQPVLNINNPAPGCLPNTINLTDSLVTAGSSNGTLSYWTNYSATDTLYAPNTISSSDTNFIKLTAIGGCYNIDSVITFVNQHVVANAGQDVAICSGTIDSIGTDAINGIIYSWAPGLGLSDSTISNPIIVATNTTLNPYTSNYILTATDTITSCQSSDTVSVTINPQPLLIINQPTAICQPGSINLTDSSITQGSIGGNTYSYWQNSSATDTLLSTQINSTDTNFIKLTAIGGCFAIDSVITIINPAPVTSAGSDLSICSGTIGTIGSPAINGYNYLWTPGLGLSDSTISQPQNTITNNTNIPIIATYKLTTTIVGTGCKSYDTVSVTVNPQPNLVITQPSVSCASQPIDLTDSAITAGSTPNVSYGYWTDIDATDTLLTATAIEISDTNYIKITATGGCYDIKPVITSINPLTLINFTGLNYNNCYNAAPQLLTGNPAGGTFSGNGVVGDTFTAAIAGPGTQPVTYTYVDTNGCSSSTSQFIQILAPTNITAQICMVTVNSASNHNIIYWNKDQYTSNVDSFIVYRETLLDSFQRIGAVPFASLGQYTDTTAILYFPNTGNPNTASYRYKLQVRDTCDVYTPLSQFHQTMYLINNQGTFNWTPYMIDTSSTPIPELTSYVLLRDGNNTGSWDVIASAPPSQLTIADPNYTSYPNGRWKVETLWSISCNPSNPLNKSTSNIVTDTSTIGIAANKAEIIAFNIYPNPYSNNTNISYSLTTKSEITIEVYNAIGQKVITLLNSVQQKGKYTYPFSAKELGYNSGIYFVRMNVNGMTSIKRIVETD